MLTLLVPKNLGLIVNFWAQMCKGGELEASLHLAAKNEILNILLALERLRKKQVSVN